MYICDKCFKIYNLFSFIKVNDIYEPIIDAEINCLTNNCDGILFDVDELFAPMISLLNKKGYKTIYCCSGHIRPDEEIIYNKKYQKRYKNYIIESYISFDISVKLPNIPKGYSYDKSTGSKLDNTIRKTFNYRKRSENILIDILNNTKSVLKWVKSLPKL